MTDMEYETEDQQTIEAGNAWDDYTRPDVSSVFMTLARRALATSDGSGMPPDEELRRLAKWCELYRFELFALSKIQTNTESKQRRIWLLELASMPTGRWLDLRTRLSSFTRLFGLPPRPQTMPFLSAEGGMGNRHSNRLTSYGSTLAVHSKGESDSFVASTSSGESDHDIEDREA
jgi:hypothetical protein